MTPLLISLLIVQTRPQIGSHDNHLKQKQCKRLTRWPYLYEFIVFWQHIFGKKIGATTIFFPTARRGASNIFLFRSIVVSLMAS